MDNYERNLLEQALDLLHRIIGYADARVDTKPVLHMFVNEQKTIPFPGNVKTPPANEQGAVIFNTPDVGLSGSLEEGFVEFTEKEILQMPQHFRKIINVNRNRCRMRRRKCGNGYTYEIRFRSNGYNVSAGGKTVELARENMLHKLREIKPQNVIKTKNGIPTVFQDFALYYFERFRKPKVAPLTYENDKRRLKKYILPAFGKKTFRQITPSDCESLIYSLSNAGKGKTADEVYSILSVIFKGAIAHNLIARNPISIVPRVMYETKHGKALSQKEIDEMFNRINDSHFEIVYALALYTGLRPNELKTATVENGMIVAVNSKQHKKETVYKRIPICKRLDEYLQRINRDLSIFPFKSEKYYSTRFPSFCPEHKLYDLRTTFYSKCKELGIAEPALKAYMGHSNGKIGNSYTDLSNAYLLKEGIKLNDW